MAMKERRRKSCRFTADRIEKVDYKDVERLRRYVTDRGKPVLKVVPYTEKPEAWLKPLRGTVKSYKKPTEPLSEDWEALQ